MKVKETKIAIPESAWQETENGDFVARIAYNDDLGVLKSLPDCISRISCFLNYILLYTEKPSNSVISFVKR